MKGKQKQNNARFRKKPNFHTNDSLNHKPKYPCLICGKDHFTKDCPHRDDVNCFVKGNAPPPVVLTNHFPNQTNQMESQDQTTGLAISQVLMCQKDIRVTTRNKDYSHHEASSSKSPLTKPTPPTNGPPEIKRPTTKTIKPPPKNILHKLTFNPHVRAAQSYNNV